MPLYPTIDQLAGGTSPWPVSGSITATGTSAVSGTLSLTGALPAGTALLGDVNLRGYSAEIAASPVLSGGVAYATGQLLGSLMTIAGAVLTASGISLLQSLTISDKSKQNAAMTLVLFSQNPASTTFGDHQALNVAAADLLHAKVVPIPASAWISFGSNSVASLGEVALEFSSQDTNLYACLMSGGAPTYNSTSDLALTASILQIR